MEDMQHTKTSYLGKYIDFQIDPDCVVNFYD